MGVLFNGARVPLSGNSIGWTVLPSPAHILVCLLVILMMIPCLFQVTMTTGLDRDTIRAAYEDVRSDTSPTEW